MNTPDSVALSYPPDLRPLGVADMLDAAVRIYRSHLLKLVLIAAVVMVPLAALEVAVRAGIIIPLLSPTASLYQTTDDANRVLAGQVLNIAWGFVTTVIVNGVMMPALVWGAAQGYWGKPVSLRAAYGRTLRRLPIMAVVVVIFAAVSLVALLALLGAAVLVIVCIGIAGVPLVAGGWLFIAINMLTLLAPVAMLEDGGVETVLKRSWALTRANFWQAFGLLAALYLFSIFATLGPTTLAIFVVALLAEQLVLATSINIGLQTLISLAYMPLWGAGLAVLYYHARVRCEALDLQLLAGLDAAPIAPARMVWTDGSDWLKVIILTGIILVPLALCVGAYMFVVMLGMLFSLAGPG